MLEIEEAAADGDPLAQFMLGGLRAQRAADAAAGSPVCTVCGCTENAACEDGCGWASLDPPLCTRCA
jgi:hypothetical protein